MEEGVFGNTLGIRRTNATKKVSFVILTLLFQLYGGQDVQRV